MYINIYMIRLKRLDFEYDIYIYIYIEKDIIGYRCCGRVFCLSPQLVGIVHMCLGFKFIRYMWEASLPDVGLRQNREAQPKRTIPTNWGLRQETLPHYVVAVHMCLGLKLIRHMWEASLPDVGLSKTVRYSQSGEYLLIRG